MTAWSPSDRCACRTWRLALTERRCTDDHGPGHLTGGSRGPAGRVTTETRDQVLMVGIDRPEKRNALTSDILKGLAATYADYDADDGTVALAEATARWTGPRGWVSDDQGQFRERIGKPRDGRYVGGPEIVEAPAEVLNEGVRGNDDPCGSVSGWLLAWTSMSWKAVDSNSSSTRG